MIKITEAPTALRLRGHAGGWPRGENPVCAAVSILLYTLAAGITQLEERGLVTEVTIRLEAGDGEVSARPGAEGERETILLFENARRGLALLAEQFPEEVRFI